MQATMVATTLKTIGLIRCVMLVALFMSSQALLADDKLKVFVSVLPQKLFVERIGGDFVDVNVMVKPGFSPATYEPSPRQIAALAKAQLYIRIGVPFEQAWLPRIRSVNRDMLVIDARKGVELLKIIRHSHSKPNSAELKPDDKTGKTNPTSKPVYKTDLIFAKQPTGPDPHLWTSPRLVVKMADQIKQKLIDLQPAQSKVFEKNHAALVDELNELDEELQALFAASTVKAFMVFHPSWGYFAAAYGLQQVAIEAEGKEPGAKALRALIKQARATGVKTIFVQPQFDQRTARQVAKAIGGTVVAINALSADYFANTRRTARLIAGIADE